MERVNIWALVVVIIIISMTMYVLAALLFVKLYPFLGDAYPGFFVFLYGLSIIIASFCYTKKLHSIEDLIFKIDRQEILDVREATEGLPFAGEGVIVAEKTLKSPYCNVDCVCHHSVTLERERKEWFIIENLLKFVPFCIKDRSGVLQINHICIDKDLSEYTFPSKRKSEIQKLCEWFGGGMISHSEIDLEPMIYEEEYKHEVGKVPILKIPIKVDRKRSEWVLKPGTKVFVFGVVRKKGNKLSLCDSEEYPLIISRKSKDEWVEEFYKGADVGYLFYFFVVFGFTISLIGIDLILAGLKLAKMFGPLFWLLFITGNAIIICSFVSSLWNRIVLLETRAQNALSEIDVELKRRYDLIPALAEVVKGYTKYEREITQLIAELRAQIVFHSEMHEQKSELKSLIANIEKYPELRANKNFKRLMEEIIDTEERIAYAREFYNEAVMRYNATIAQYPFILISLPLGIKPKQYVTLETMA